ncbi:MAG: fasciclin domain-containing protein [Bacteroidaceae bacterium]|nr:fasciclin domain-containing protein [Bacteroidaceae bacterium]
MIRIKPSFKLFLAAVALVCVCGCKETIDTSARYVFTEETILSYLEKHEAYSSYVDLLRKVDVSRISGSKVSQLLSARGVFTVFAPTNEAIQKYLESLVEEGLITEPSWDAFPNQHKLDSIRKVIVFNSIINGGDEPEAFYYTYDFPEKSGDEFILANLNDEKLSVRYVDKEPDSIYINKDCPISSTERDILSINGIIHQIGKVIAPKNITATKYIQECLDEKKGDFLACFRVIQACGLLDTLNAVRDERYEELYQTGQIPNLVGMTSYGFAEGEIGYAPKHRLYGFTIFAEPDDFWLSEGIDPADPDLLRKLIQWIIDNHQYSEDDKFTTDDNYESEDNLLYQWITYHILPMRIPKGKLVFHFNEYGYNLSKPLSYSIPVYEFYTTMGKRRLFKLTESGASNGVYINRFPITDNGRRGTGEEIGCKPDKVGALVDADSPKAILEDMTNCIVYPIDAPISYNDEVRNDLQRNRIRFDGMSLFPEAMNNDIRLKKATGEDSKHVYIPNTVRTYNYFENMQQNADMNFVYYNAWNDDWCNLHRDEMKAVGRFDVTFKLPPVPRRGTYEVRYKVLANGNRGIAQIYFGNNPDQLPVTGIPLDLTKDCRNALTAQEVGWVVDDPNDDDSNAEHDKNMRNNGYMKGPKSINSNDGTERDWNDRENIRHIFVRQTLDPNETYYIRLKSVLDSDRKEFYMDFIEYCAKEIYDNPIEPEDIW